MRRGLPVCLLLLFPLSNPLAQAAPAGLLLDVDSSDIGRRLIRARLTIPARPGPLALHYPKWIPGEHTPGGPINDLAGLTLRAGGRPLAWTQDPLDPFTVRSQVPDGVEGVEVSLSFLLSGARGGFGNEAAATARLAVLNWNQVLLYPAGGAALRQPVRASLRLPRGWKLGTALPIASREGELIRFAPTSLEMLVDSPVLVGLHLKEVPIGPAGHSLVLAADSEAALVLKPGLQESLGRLIKEALHLFGGRHYRSYRFLVALSDQLTLFGLEHHESTDIRLPEASLRADGANLLHSILAHEYAHSWNGKHRRPADMVTGDFQQPQRTRLLWVYEGLTQYLGWVLSSRSGLWPAGRARERLADGAHVIAHQRGRSWRNLANLAAAFPTLINATEQGSSWRRSAWDVYDEGSLLWLEIDGLIRKLSSGRRSLDDFCRRFFAGSGPPEVKPYDLDELVRELNAVAAHDWRALLEARLLGTPPTVEAGLRAVGWQIAYESARTELQKEREAEFKYMDLRASLGLVLQNDGKVLDVIPAGPADRAGVAPGMMLRAVSSRRFNPGLLREQLAGTPKVGALWLLLEEGEFFRHLKLRYSGGERHPQLRRLPGLPDHLADILAPRLPTGRRR